MQKSTTAGWVEYHNILGLVPPDRVLSKVAGQSDGVVTVESARLPNATSELIVNADHINIHRHPRTVLEVQRILLRHLDQKGCLTMERLPEPSDSALSPQQNAGKGPVEALPVPELSSAVLEGMP
jgi:hypothetical protein